MSDALQKKLLDKINKTLAESALPLPTPIGYVMKKLPKGT